MVGGRQTNKTNIRIIKTCEAHKNNGKLEYFTVRQFNGRTNQNLRGRKRKIDNAVCLHSKVCPKTTG